uniref:SEA domain-containing protein n=1 Tax=Lepisosteus oculatus TaxID=7918 RepID=W5MHU9_LEPOC
MWIRSSLCLLFAAACVLPTSTPDSGSTTSAATTASRLAESSTSGAGVTAPPTGTQANVTSAAGDPHLTQTPGGTSAVSTQTTPGSGAPAQTTASAVTTHPQATPGRTSSDSPTGSREQGIPSTTSSVSVASTAALTTLPGAAQTTPSTATANTTGATAPPGGTTGAATATGIPAPAVRQLSFSLDQTFIPQLSDNTSPEFQGLARNISAELNKVYSAKFNEIFLGSVVRHLRNGSIVADVELQFRSQASAPSPQEVKVTLQGAVQSGSFPLPVNTSTIQAQ